MYVVKHFNAETRVALAGMTHFEFASWPLTNSEVFKAIKQFSTDQRYFWSFRIVCR